MRFRDAFLITVVTQGSIVFLGAVNSIIITRSVGPEGRGIYSLLLAFVVVASLAMGGGLTLSNVYSVGINRKNVGIVFINSVLFSSFVSTLLLLCYFKLPQRCIESLFSWISMDYAGIAISLVIATLFFNCVNNIYLGLQKYVHYGVFQLLQIALFFLLNIIFLCYCRCGLNGVFYSWLFSLIVGLVLCVLFLFRIEGRIRLVPDIMLLLRDIKTGGRALMANILYLMFLQVSLFVIKYFLGVKAVGIYSVAYIISDLILRIPKIGGSVLLPKVSAWKDTDSVELTLILSRIMLVFGVFVSLFMVVFGKHIISVVFGREFISAYEPMIWLLPGIIGLSIHAVMDNFFAGKGYPFITIWSAVAALIAILVFSTVFVYSFGMIGAPIASSIAFWLITLIKSVYFSRTYSVRLSEIFIIKKRDLHVMIDSLKMKERGERCI